MNKELKQESRKLAGSLLIEELLLLRAKIGISQDELAEYVGISRQTLLAIETKKEQ